MANEPAFGSYIVAGVRKTVDSNGNYPPSKVTVDESLTPAALVVTMPDNSLRDLGIVTVDGTVSIQGGLGTDAYTQAIAYNGNNAQYLGYAAPGSSKASAVWAIKKLTYSGNLVTDIQWAGGAASFTQVWDDRASLSYS